MAVALAATLFVQRTPPWLGPEPGIVGSRGRIANAAFPCGAATEGVGCKLLQMPVFPSAHACHRLGRRAKLPHTDTLSPRDPSINVQYVVEATRGLGVLFTTRSVVPSSIIRS